MKQKNLILMVVAVGCGLLAAFLTSQMSAKPASAPQQIDVLVVAKELPPGTKFTMDSVKDQFKRKKFNPDTVPEKAVIVEEMLDGKTLNKTLRADDFVREADLGNYQPLIPPEGKHIASVRLAPDKMTPFLQPNSRVDIIGVKLKEDSKVKSIIVLPNVLVMAVDIKHRPPQSTEGDMAIQMASLAVTQEEAQAIRLCELANVKLSFILRNDTTGATGDPNWKLSQIETWVNGDKEEKLVIGPDQPMLPPGAGGTPDKPAEATVKMTVPISDLPAGTELTSDVVQNKFKEVPLVGAAPANAVLNIKEHIGRFLVKDVAAEQFIPKSYLSDKFVAGGERKAPGENTAPREGTLLPDETPKVKVQIFDRSYITPAGTKVYRYEITDKGLKLLGEVAPNGDITPVTGVAPPAPKADEVPPKKVF